LALGGESITESFVAQHNIVVVRRSTSFARAAAATFDDVRDRIWITLQLFHTSELDWCAST
jgi:hypothetical protein